MNSVSFKTNTEIQYSYSVDKKPNPFLNYSYSVIRNEYQWQNIRIRIRFLITPIRFTPSSNSKGPYTYYTITLGGVGGPGTNDDIDGALRGGWGV